jgi:hypothetical protein
MPSLGQRLLCGLNSPFPIHYSELFLLTAES